MNNIQKMENKVYKAHIRELESDLWEVEGFYYTWALSNEGRRNILRGIRGIAKAKIYHLGNSKTLYDSLKSQRDYSLNLIRTRGQ